MKRYYTSNLKLRMPYFWSAQLGNSAAALRAQGVFFYCIEWFAAFQFPVLWLYKMWNICDCLVLR